MYETFIIYTYHVSVESFEKKSKYILCYKTITNFIRDHEGHEGPCDHSDGELLPLSHKSRRQHVLSGKRLAVFGLHTFTLDKITEYEKTGKSDYFIVPVIGETSTLIL